MQYDDVLFVFPYALEELIFTSKDALPLSLDWKTITDKLRRFVARQIADIDDAEDIVQDTFAGLFESADVENSVRTATSWLYTTARNKIIDRYRRNARRRNVQTGTSEDERPATRLSGPEDLLKRTEVWDELALALDELPAEQRDVFIWNELDGVPFSELAQRTGDNLNTLLSRKRYAVLHLRSRMRELFEDLKGDGR